MERVIPETIVKVELDKSVEEEMVDETHDFVGNEIVQNFVTGNDSVRLLTRIYVIVILRLFIYF